MLTASVSEQQFRKWAPVLGRIVRRPWKNRTIANMKLFLRSAHWTEAQWERLWKANTRHVGQTIVEFIVWHRMSREEVLNRISIRGEHHLHETLRAGRGAMVLASHTGNFLALAPGLHKAGVPAVITGQQMPTPFLRAFLHGFLGRYGARHLKIGQGLLPMAAAESFKRGATFSCFVDYSLAGKRDVWLQFGHAETNVSIGPVLLARRHRVPVLCVSCRRLDASRHEVIFHPPLPMPVTNDARADARLLTEQALQIVAEDIQKNVDQWWEWDWAPLRSRAHSGEHYRC